MIVMLDTNQDLETCADELGCDVEELFTPLTRRSPQRPGGMFAIDNGAFSRFDSSGFLRLLDRESPRKGLCRFVAVPDVVGSSVRTLEVFTRWAPRLAGWPLAFVVQDGQEHHPIPWDDISAVFVGGSTEWKMGRHATACVKAAKALAKWVHAGRVNTPGRFEHFEDIGADSIDGTGLARYSHMREAILKRNTQPDLLQK